MLIHWNHNRGKPLWLSALLGFLILAQGEAAAGCLAGSCHQELAEPRYLHGPVAAEQVRPGGCVACHHPAGRPCQTSHGGEYLLDTIDLCQTCHDGGTGNQHSVATPNCLSCHTPHGSATSPFMLRQQPR